MIERVGITAKKPEVNRDNSGSRMQRTNHPLSVNTSVDRIQFLQRTVGNQAVQRLLRSGALQAKLRIGQPGDKYEQEADRVADAVMRMPEPGVQRQVEPEEEEEEEEEPFQTKRESNSDSSIQLQPDEEEKEEVLQNSKMSGKNADITTDLELKIHAIRGGGQLLPESERAFFEPRFGYDFSQVRMHTDSKAAESAREVNAKAFTLGQDVVFGAGQYAPDTSAGKKLLAHELTHVVQQGKDHSGQSNNKMLQRTGGGCTPASGIPNTNCGPYAANSWWLPSAYVNNATCACQTTPNVPTANCVRKFLQDRLAATPRWLKVMAFSHKSLDNPITYAQYQTFVQAFLTPRIYRDHVDAYRSCCCPSGPAPYPAWIGVTSVPLPCSAVGLSIRYFGSCHGTPGRW